MTRMPKTDPVPLTLRRELDRLWEAIRKLETPVHEEDIERYSEYEAIFSYAGTPIVGEASPMYHVRWPMAIISALRVSFATPPDGTDATIVELLVNGEAVASCIHDQSGGDDAYHALADDLNIRVEEWDRVQVRCSVLAAGVADVTVQALLMVPSEGA